MFNNTYMRNSTQIQFTKSLNGHQFWNSIRSPPKNESERTLACRMMCFFKSVVLWSQRKYLLWTHIRHVPSYTMSVWCGGKKAFIERISNRCTQKNLFSIENLFPYIPRPRLPEFSPTRNVRVKLSQFLEWIERNKMLFALCAARDDVLVIFICCLLLPIPLKYVDFPHVSVCVRVDCGEKCDWNSSRRYDRAASNISVALTLLALLDYGEKGQIRRKKLDIYSERFWGLWKSFYCTCFIRCRRCFFPSHFQFYYPFYWRKKKWQNDEVGKK